MCRLNVHGRSRSARTSGPSPRGYPSPHVRTNLELWEAQSDAYDRRHRGTLAGRSARAWGFWRVPEDRLHLLGPTVGKTVLELGCGAGRWSIALARRGASCVGLDISTRQLAKARRLGLKGRFRGAWVRANAERLPLRDRSFDVVFSDWGAMTFCDPGRTVPEVSRVLRARGRFVFATSSPFRALTQDRRTDRIGRTLLYDYFGLGRVRYPDEVNFVPTYEGWVRLFRDHGLVVEALLETRAPRRRRSSYLGTKEQRWGRRWPLESIWVLTREATRARPARTGRLAGVRGPARTARRSRTARKGNL